MGSTAAAAKWRQMNANLTHDAYRGWDEWSGTQGVSLSALLQAIGEAMAAGRVIPDPQVIERARAVDRERRLRPNRRRKGPAD